MDSKNEIITANLEALITTRCLGLFFYNFTHDRIDELCENSREFKHVWSKLENRAKKRQEEKGGMLIIDHKEFYEAYFSKMSYATQALVIEKAKDLHEHNVRDSIAFAIELENRVEEIKKARN